MEDNHIFSSKDWFNVYGVVVMDIPALPDNIAQILKGDCGIREGKQVKDTHRLVLMPKYVIKDGKRVEVTLESYGNPNDGLISDVKTAHQAHSKINSYSPLFEEGNEGKEKSWSQVSVDQTMWCLVYVGYENQSNGLLKGSRWKTWDEQVNYLKEVNNNMAKLVSEKGWFDFFKKRLEVSKGEKTGDLYSIAKPLELVILAMGFYNKTGDKVLSHNQTGKPWSYARTEYTWSGGGWGSGNRVGVGYFDSGGLAVCSYSSTSKSAGYGIGVLRKFCKSDSQ